jgi:hypothetical protein
LKILKLSILFLFFVSAMVQAETLFYFPHYGDGDGLSMVFTFENPTDMEARVYVYNYDSDGNLTPLEYVGYDSYTCFFKDLEPHGSLTLKTTGTSNPLKVGYVMVQSDNDNITGIAIFQYASGGETSVLPVKAKKRFVLPFEKNSSMDMGLAICREAIVPIDIELYNPYGDLVDEVTYNPSTYHSAAFSAEIFGTVSISNGIVLLKSESPFAPMGLRFGNDVLASLPSDEAKESSQYWAEKMCEPSGFWYFDYTISGTYTNIYSMYQAAEFIGYSADYMAIGMDEWGEDVIASWDEGEGQIFFLDQSLSFDYAFIFDFTSDNLLEGCMHLRDIDTGALGTCYAFSGERFVYTPVATEKAPRITVDPATRKAHENRMLRDFTPVITSGPLKETFDLLAARNKNR